ncbi:MAG: SRPBCC family protein [Pirellulaceae bacterium]|nr:SRPBCC family protein [Planctomycetales bacterium]
MPKYHVHRSINISASPETVYQHVADFGTWTTWSPWLCAEPQATVTVSSPSSKVGAVYSWSGDVVGAGEIEHQHLQPGKLIEDEIRFTKPFRSKSKVSFDFQPSGDGTTVTWHMHGSLPWFMFWMVSQLQTYIGMDYERGLKMLKELIETGKIQSKTEVRGVEEIGPLQILGVRRQCQSKDIGETMTEAFNVAHQRLCAENISYQPAAISVYHKVDVQSQTFDFTSGFVVPSPPASSPSGLQSWSLPASKALRVNHVGRYDHLGNAWSAAYQVARYKKLKQSKAGAFEIYRNDPQTTPAPELVTEVYLPLR